MTTKYRLTVTLPDKLLAGIEAYRAEHCASEPLSEVIRVLIGVGLETERKA